MCDDDYCQSCFWISDLVYCTYYKSHISNVDECNQYLEDDEYE